MSEKVLVSVDCSNLFHMARKHFGRKIDYSKYLDIALDNYAMSCYRAFAYGAQVDGEADGFISCLRSFGFEPKYKRPKEFTRFLDSNIERALKDANIDVDLITSIASTAKREIRKADWDIGIAIDVVRHISRVDTVVLGTSDDDFVPLVEYIKEQGCYCIVYACNIPKTLRNVANQCIEIDDRVLEEKRD